MNQYHPRRAFTLLEVLLVLAILGVIAAIVIPLLIGRQKGAMIKATESSIYGLEQALKLYAIDHDAEFPPGNSDQAFQVLLNPGVDEKGVELKPYLEKIPLDAWRQPFYYESPTTKVPRGLKPAIWSSGPNKQNENGGGDDINNWSDLTL
jgi:general secretion pathway protein G